MARPAPLLRTLCPLSLAAFPLLQACVTPLAVAPPALRYESPEASGGALWAGAGVALRPAVVLTPDITTRAPDVSTPAIRTSDGVRVGVGGGFGRAEVRVDLPGTVALKVQFLGEPRPRARTGDLSGAILVGGSSGQTSVAAEVCAYGLFSFSKTCHGAQAEYDEVLVEVGLLGGYRVSPSGLLYAGIFRADLDISGQHRWTGETSTPRGPSGLFSGQVAQWGATAGLQVDDARGFMRFEAGVARTSMGASRATLPLVGAMVGRRLGR